MKEGKTKVTDVSQLKASRISKTDALSLMQNSKGRFFTAVFTKKNGKTRAINGQYCKDQSLAEQGYIHMQIPGKANPDRIRNVNVQTLSALYMSGRVLKVN